MEYSIVFSGQMVDGVSRARAVKAISEMINAQEWDVVAQFFSAERVIVKRLDSKVHAEQYQRAFRRAGIETTIESDEEPSDDIETDSERLGVNPVKAEFDDLISGRLDDANNNEEDISEEETIPQDPDVIETVDSIAIEPEKPLGEMKGPSPPKAPPPVKRKDSKQFLKALRNVALLAALVAVLLAWLNAKLLDPTVPQAVVDVEQALATKRMIGMAHLNIEKIAAIENVVSYDTSRLFSPAFSLGTLGEFDNAGIKLRKMAKHGVFSLTREGEKTTSLNTILLGDFDVDNILGFVRAQFDVRESTLESGDKHYLFRKLEKNHCGFTATKSLYLDNDLMVISSPEGLEEIVTRIKARAKGEVDINPWQRFREKHLVSAGVFETDGIQTLPPGVLTSALSNAFDIVKDTDAIYTGLDADLFPLNLSVNTHLLTQDKKWIEKTHASLRKTAVNENALLLARGFNSISDLLGVVAFTGGENRLTISASLDSTRLGGLQQSMDEYIANYLVVKDRARVPPNLLAKQERYKSDFSINDITSFTVLDSDIFNPQWTDGPFGLKVKDVSISPDGLYAIHLAFEGRSIINYAPEKKIAGVKVSAVLDNAGNNIMKTNACDNIDPDRLKFFGESSIQTHGAVGILSEYRKIEQMQVIELDDEASLQEVKQIRGYIELAQPTKLHRVVVEAPFEGKRISISGADITLLKGGAGKISYMISGDTGDILAIRPLNISSSYLPVTHVERASNESEVIRVETKYFKSTAKLIEIISIQNRHTIKYPFALDNYMPRITTEKLAVSMPVASYTLKGYDTVWSNVGHLPLEENDFYFGTPASSYHYGPISIAYFDESNMNSKDFSNNLFFKLPPIPSLHNNLSGLEVHFDHKEFVNQDVEPLGVSIFPVVHYPIDPIRLEFEKTHLEGTYPMAFVSLKDRHKVAKYHGRVTLRFPSFIKRLSIDRIKLGAVKQSKDYRVRLTTISEGGVTLSINGVRPNIVSIIAKNKNGASINQGDATITGAGNRWFARQSFAGEIDSIEFIYAKTIQSKTLPMVLDL